MTSRVGFSAAALSDEESAIGWYLTEAGSTVAQRFTTALANAYELISAAPYVGSLRHAHSLEIPGLRTVKVERFPYLVFYIERPDSIDVVRVLHTRQDSSPLMNSEQHP